MYACISLHKSQNRLLVSSREQEVGLFLPDGLCLKKEVLTDSWAPGPYWGRVQCGCLTNEVDYRDYNQAGNISLLICQSSGESLPVLQCQSELFSFRLVHVYHTAMQTHVAESPGQFKDTSGPWRLMEGGVMVGNPTMGPLPKPRRHRGHSNTYKLSPVAFLAVKHGCFSRAWL